MYGLLGKLVHGNWPARLITAAEILVGLMAVMVIAALLSRNPFLLLILAPGQALFLIGVVLFATVAIFSQRTMVLERFQAGETIFREGDPGQHIYVIKSGKVDVFRTQPDGTERLIERLGAGDHVGDLALLGEGLPRRTTVRAAMDTEVFRLNPNALFVLYQSLPEIRECLREQMDPYLAKLKPHRSAPKS
jgi:CRP-like cAMP-binding protein